VAIAYMQLYEVNKQRPSHNKSVSHIETLIKVQGSQLKMCLNKPFSQYNDDVPRFPLYHVSKVVNKIVHRTVDSKHLL
jgi:hypothetical protein